MKKIYILCLIALAGIAVSCDMDKMMKGVLSDEDSILSPEDCRSFRNGLYSTMRLLTTGRFIYYSDLQVDQFHLVAGNNPIGTGLNTGKFQPAMSEFEEIWGAYYATIGSVNFFVGKVNLLLASDEFTEEEKVEMRYYKAEALFVRAYCYFYLAERFCPAYGINTANTPAAGLPLVTTYDPTADNAQYPGRNTLEETYNRIFDDLKEALGYFLTYETSVENATPAAMSPYVTSDVVKALWARTALVTKDYPTAMKYAEEVINSRRYSIEPSMSLSTFWEYDYGNEALMLVTMTQQHLGYATGSYFLRNTGNVLFIPTKASVDLFDKESDNRYKVYFTDWIINQTEATATIDAFNKYPGNKMLYTSVNNFVNMGKPFRISEQYLIAAEAAAESGQESKANRYLNDLKSRRMNGYSSQQQTGEFLRTSIREERHRELFGEGFRFGDLKRWGLGFQRSDGQDNRLISTNGNVHRLEYQPDDHRFVWPIPKAEIDANPQIKNQQNPGY